MKLRILPSALADLARGRRFYARHGEELGEYFLNSLFADIDSLVGVGSHRGQRRGATRELAIDTRCPSAAR